jgi:hypothetical protein
MDSLGFYVIAQGRIYKNGICQINFGNTCLSLPYVLSVGIIFCHIRNNPEMGGKKRLSRSYQSLEVVTTSERILHVFIGQITFSNQPYKKSPRAEVVRL